MSTTRREGAKDAKKAAEKELSAVKGGLGSYAAPAFTANPKFMHHSSSDLAALSLARLRWVLPS
jgi:hypothetical protein